MFLIDLCSKCHNDTRATCMGPNGPNGYLGDIFSTEKRCYLELQFDRTAFQSRYFWSKFFLAVVEYRWCLKMFVCTLLETRYGTIIESQSTVLETKYGFHRNCSYIYIYIYRERERDVRGCLDVIIPFKYF